MLCVIAASPQTAKIVKQALERMTKFKDWRFELVTHTDELSKWEDRRPHVLVISRCLPGESHEKLFPNLQLRFMVSHIVILAGKVTESTKGYIRMAETNGLENIVTGPLPGDKPYPIYYALDHHKDFSKGPVIFEEDDLTDEDEQTTFPTREDIASPIPSKREVLEKRKASIETVKKDSAKEPGLIDIAIPRRRIVIKRSLNILDTRKHRPRPTTPTDEWYGGRKGLMTFTVANKGGVGKTTTNHNLGIALSNSKIKTVLWDLDFEGPDLGTFFKIDNGLGIEYLANKRITPAMVEDVLFEVNENLYILPGPMKPGIPDFRPGQLTQIADILRNRFDVVIGDTPPGFTDKWWLKELFKLTDLAFCVVDQSIFSEKENYDYAPLLVMMGVQPQNMRLILNKFSPKLHNPRRIEAQFCAGFKKSVDKKKLPRIIATIGENWDAYVKAGYKGKALGVDDPKNPLHKVCVEVADMIGQKYELPSKKSKEKVSVISSLKNLIKRR